jgi:sulfate permease, SulP family
MQSLPVSVAFCNIMYTSPIYSPFVPEMARLLIGSNALHQFVMTSLSSLPFVVGQVQDIGLIFIHAETEDISTRMKGEPAERIMGTAMLASMLSNIILGLCFILVGKCVLTVITCPCC